MKGNNARSLRRLHVWTMSETDQFIPLDEATTGEQGSPEHSPEQPNHEKVSFREHNSMRSKA